MSSAVSEASKPKQPLRTLDIVNAGLAKRYRAERRFRRALRVNPMESDNFPQDVLELQAFLAPVQEGQAIQAVPGAGTEVPLWILGSSTFGSQLAAMLGLPYAFASHFAPDALYQALDIYRANFQPSAERASSHAMAGVNVIVAETDAEANFHFSSLLMRFTEMILIIPQIFLLLVMAAQPGFTAAARASSSAQRRYAASSSVVSSSERSRACAMSALLIAAES